MSFYKPHDQWKLITPVIFNDSNRSFGNFFHFNDKVLHINIQRDPKFYSIIFCRSSVFALHSIASCVFITRRVRGEDFHVYYPVAGTNGVNGGNSGRFTRQFKSLPNHQLLPWVICTADGHTDSSHGIRLVRLVEHILL